MAIFVNQTQGYFLLTNFKVMYSTLAAQSNLREIVLRNYLDCIKFKSQQSQKQTIMLVRNPYSKLTSFFEDKFRQHPSMSAAKRIEYSDERGWQACQRIFFPYLKLETDHDLAIAERLKNTSFVQFMTWLPSVYQQDEHLLPQVRAIDFSMPLLSLADDSAIAKTVKINFHLDRIIKFEHLERDYMQQELALDLSQIRNENKRHQSWQDYYQFPALIEIVNRLYRDDFIRFDYPYL